MKKKTKNIFKSKKGITLIALVVTIVVLLILAAVSISMLGGENGIITQAQKAKDENIIAEEKEAITLAIAAIKTRLENVNKDNLKEEIEKIKKKESVEVTEIGENLLEVKYEKTGNVYNVNKDGELIDLETKLNASYEFYSNPNELYITPYIENPEEILQVMTEEEWIKSLETAMSKEEKEKMFLDYMNIVTGSSYKTIDEFLEDTGSSSVDEFIQNEVGTEGIITNLDEFIYVMGYEGIVIIENPDGSLNYGMMNNQTENGYPAEIVQTYTFKIRFMGIEKTIKIDMEEIEKKALKILVNSGEDGIVGMPINANQYVKYEIDWGDGTTGIDGTLTGKTGIEVASVDKIYIAESGYAIEHKYSEKNKEYVVTIMGECTWIDKYAMNCTTEKIIEILQWGETGLTDINLSDCTNLRKIASPTENSFLNVEDFRGTFAGCTGLTSIPEDLFANCPNVQSFGSTFAGCTSLTSIPEDLFANCPNVQYFISTFSGCTSLTGNPIRLWERVENGNSNGYQGEPDGEGCYYGCEGLENYNNIPDYWKQKEMPN